MLRTLNVNGPAARRISSPVPYNRPETLPLRGRLMEIGDIVLVAAITVAALILLRILIAFMLAGWDASRVFLARRVALKTLRDPAFAAKVHDLLEPKPPEPSGEAVRILALLQREGRLLDFLLEDVQSYTNDQIGAAVRDIHGNCQHALKEHIVLG